MMDYDCRSSEKRLAAVENDWLAAPENAELLEVYTCSLCGNHIFEGDRSEERTLFPKHGNSSVGRASVSKTECREFEPLFPC